jgi:hypothetical protein
VRGRLTHKTKAVEAFLTAPQGAFLLHPTYSSWLNQVELRFAKIERDVIARGRLHFDRRSPPQTNEVDSRPKPSAHALSGGPTRSQTPHRFSVGEVQSCPIRQRSKVGNEGA